ncbi:M30 family metallopeptidase [Chromobacterium phragmitis]|uniref:Hemagglutinin n=1 Tax=Chromobacterium phragmitis TaxID=2202141 RepID=A0ABV0IU48_9NEIS
MLNKKQNLLVLSVMAAALSGCGGGGGGEGSSSSFTQKSQISGDLNCQTSACSMPAGAATDPAGKVYLLQNASNQEATVTIDGPLTNSWDAVMTRISSDTAGNGRIGGGARGGDGAADAILAQKMQVVYDNIATYAGISQRAQARMKLEKRVTASARYALNDSRAWYDSIGSRTLNTTMKASAALPSGGTVYVWAQDDAAAVTAEQANFLAERFANSVYPIESAVISEPWGSVASTWRAISLDSGTKDVHLVLAQLNQPANAFKGLMGYVLPTNALLKSVALDPACATEDCSPFANSNEALVTFLNVDTLVAKDDGQLWSQNGRGPALSLSTLGHEYQHLLYSYNKLFRQNITGATTWENELAAQTMGYLVAADTYHGGRSNGPDAHPDLGAGSDFTRFLASPACDLKRWPALSSDASGVSCYPKALATGMLMLHQYGAGVMKPWVTGANVGEKALNDGLASVGGGNYGSLMQRLYTSLLLADFPTWAAGYGFPAKQVTLPASPYLIGGKAISLPEVRVGKQEVQLTMDSTQEAYRVTLIPMGGKVTIAMPANSRLSLVKR